MLIYQATYDSDPQPIPRLFWSNFTGLFTVSQTNLLKARPLQVLSLLQGGLQLSPWQNSLSYKTLIKGCLANQALPSSSIWIRTPTPSSFSTPISTFFLSRFYYQLYVPCTYIHCMSLWLRCELHEGWEHFIHCYIPGAWHMLTHSRHTINSCWIYGAILARYSV